MSRPPVKPRREGAPGCEGGAAHSPLRVRVRGVCAARGEGAEGGGGGVDIPSLQEPGDK